MKKAKRQIVLGALILALGAAVYLNWQFTEVTPKDLPSSGDVEENDDGLGVATLVNNNYIETVNDTIPTALKENSSDKIKEARLTRQTTRDSALEILSDILEDEDADADTKKTAVDQSSLIAQNMIKESTAENLIKAKGVEDLVVFINDGQCNVVVKGLEDNMLLIQEIIIKQTGLSLDKINIIDAK